MIRFGILISFVSFLLIAPQPVLAHAFGMLYNLPVPFWLYLYGSAAALLISFFILGLFFHSQKANQEYPSVIINQGFLSFLLKPWFLNLLKIFSFGIFLLTIISGLIGDNGPYSNFNMTFFWVIFWLGLTYLTALVGNIWGVINPLKLISDFIESKIRNRTIKPYPNSWGYYPALVVFLLFIFLELIFGSEPFSLSIILLIYTVFTLMAVLRFGSQNWFFYGDFLSVYFRLISYLSPVVANSQKLKLRPPVVGLLSLKNQHFSLLLFILFMLSSTAFDGFRETIVFYEWYWGGLVRTFNLDLGLYPLFEAIHLFLSPLIFFVFYYLALGVTKIFFKTKTSLFDLMTQFAPTLIPIALVYNIAHYYTLLLTQGQSIWRLISDPFGFGWNLFGTATYTINLSIINASVTWHLQVLFILLGHIASVYLAHMVALRIFPNSKQALLSQIPMLLLMVWYTMIGLWILAQPLSGGVI